MQLKICQSTKAITGCGEEKGIKQFPKTKHGYQKVCKQCISDARAKRDKKPTTTPETELFNQFDKLRRG